MKLYTELRLLPTPKKKLKEIQAANKQTILSLYVNGFFAYVTKNMRIRAQNECWDATYSIQFDYERLSLENTLSLLDLGPNYIPFLEDSNNKIVSTELTKLVQPFLSYEQRMSEPLLYGCAFVSGLLKDFSDEFIQLFANMFKDSGFPENKISVIKTENGVEAHLDWDIDD